MQILKYELIKIFRKKSIVIALIVFSIINVYKINYSFKNDHIVNNQYSVGKEYSDAYWRIHDKVSGPITNDSINFIKSNYKNAKQIVESGNYSTKPNQPNTYTGYIFGDMNIFKEFYDDLDYCYNYGNNLKESLLKANSNIKLYKAHKNEFQVKSNEKIAKIYSNRNITEFYDTLGYKEFFNYDFSSLLIIFILILGLSSVFSSEKESGMNPLLLSSKYGKRLTIVIKLIASMLFIFVISIYFFVLDFVSFLLIFKLLGANLPLYSMKDFQWTTLNMDIWQFIIYSDLIKILGFLCIGAIIILLSSIFSESLLPFILSTGIIIILLFANDFSSKDNLSNLGIINPISLLTNRDLFKKYSVVNLLGQPILKSTLIMICISTFILLLLLITITINRKNFFISKSNLFSYLKTLTKESKKI